MSATSTSGASCGETAERLSTAANRDQRRVLRIVLEINVALFGAMPDAPTMAVAASSTLVANLACFSLLMTCSATRGIIAAAAADAWLGQVRNPAFGRILRRAGRGAMILSVGSSASGVNR